MAIDENGLRLSELLDGVQGDQPLQMQQLSPFSNFRAEIPPANVKHDDGISFSGSWGFDQGWGTSALNSRDCKSSLD